MIRAALLAGLLLAPVAGADERIDAIVLAGAEHALWHTAGEALLGEALAGDFAVLAMASGDDAMEIERLLDVAGLWLAASERGSPVSRYHRRHGMDGEAARRIICFIAGEGPGRAHAMMARWGLPADGALTCADDFSDRLDRLEAGFANPDGDIVVTVRCGAGPWRDWLAGRELLERIGESLAADYPLGEGLSLVATPCGVAEMRWDAAARTITLCHELLDDYEMLADTLDGRTE